MIDADRFAIFGDWDATPTPEGKIRIVMPPLGHVYGAGWQDTTQAALAALAEHVTPGATFAEIGCGSGILCVAAKKLGAGKCIATELDKEALSVAAKVFKANGVEVELIEGTFPKEHVDIAVVSIASSFYDEHRRKVNATKVLVVHDDAQVEVLGKGEPAKHVPLTLEQRQQKYRAEELGMGPQGKLIRIFPDGTWKEAE
jgi:ribosomal protein L11 methylase PrmA